jgi:hypothetical protein
MHWTYGQKPRLTAAAARNPDGSWAVGLVNYTAKDFKGVQGWSDEGWNEKQGGHTPARTLNVTIEVAELKGVESLNFTVHRTNALTTNAAGQILAMKNGRLTLPVGSLELITLRSAPVEHAMTPESGEPVRAGDMAVMR